jgi:hypothetical protein
VLPFGFDRSAVNRFYDVRLIIAGSPKTGSKTERQGANGDDDQHTLQAALANSTMSYRSHVSVSHKLLRAIIQHWKEDTDITSVTQLSMKLDTEPRVLVARWFLYLNRSFVRHLPRRQHQSAHSSTTEKCRRQNWFRPTEFRSQGHAQELKK